VRGVISTQAISSPLFTRDGVSRRAEKKRMRSSIATSESFEKIFTEIDEETLPVLLCAETPSTRYSRPLNTDTMSKTSKSVDFIEKDLELRERELFLQADKLKFEREKWDTDLRLRAETIQVQATHIDMQSKLIICLIEKLSTPNN